MKTISRQDHDMFFLSHYITPINLSNSFVRVYVSEHSLGGLSRLPHRAAAISQASLPHRSVELGTISVRAGPVRGLRVVMQMRISPKLFLFLQKLWIFLRKRSFFGQNERVRGIKVIILLYEITR